MSDILNYCPDEVKVLAVGFIPITGFTDGSFVRVEKTLPPFTTHTSADGVVSRIYNRSDVYKITLTLMSTSPSNDVLTKLWQLDELTQKGKFPMLIKDMSGSDLFFSTTTWVDQLPVIDKSAEINDRTWVLQASQGFINIGGAGETGIISDLVNIAASALPGIQGAF